MQINGLDIGYGDTLESVGKFCSSGNMLNADRGLGGGCEGKMFMGSYLPS